MSMKPSAICTAIVQSSCRAATHARGGRAFWVVALTAAAPSALAHPLRAEAVPGAMSWSFEPVVIGALLLSGIIFAVGALRRRQRRSLSGREALSFTAGWLTLMIALVSPVHKLGEWLFSVHMTQHELLITIAAPLLVLGRPLVTFLWALPPPWRESLGRWANSAPVAATWQAMTGALFVWLLHGATLWLWHIPALYQASVRNEFVHALQHTTFLGTALLFWWTLLNGRSGRIASGMAVLYVFTTAVHTSILGGLMTFADSLWYPIYQGRTAAWHLTALQDQQLGGLIMWIPAGTVFTALGLWLLAAWIRESERRVAFSRSEALAAGGRNGS
jgi:putative membrane protein